MLWHPPSFLGLDELMVQNQHKYGLCSPCFVVSLRLWMVEFQDGSGAGSPIPLMTTSCVFSVFTKPFIVLSLGEADTWMEAQSSIMLAFQFGIDLTGCFCKQKSMLFYLTLLFELWLTGCFYKRKSMLSYLTFLFAIIPLNVAVFIIVARKKSWQAVWISSWFVSVHVHIYVHYCVYRIVHMYVRCCVYRMVHSVHDVYRYGNVQKSKKKNTTTP